jgi:metacaspase-1
LNSAADWLSYFQGKGFAATVLLDGQATKANIMNNLVQLVNNAYSGDIISFCFFGHGSYITDTSGDEADGRDEGICPVDVLDGYFISDDELRAIFNELRSNVTLEMFFDSCYSGTATRDLNTNRKAHYIPGPLKIDHIKFENKTKTKSKKVVKVPIINHILWAACKDNQTSWEGIVNGVYRGLFEYWMLKCLRTYPTKVRSWDIAWVQQKCGSTQTPQLECPVIENSQLPFT